VHVVAQIPRSPAGKVLRRVLRDEASTWALRPAGIAG
jgi:acyl-coenzyme A synthetase/AMP-(fatty) acid ligase